MPPTSADVVHATAADLPRLRAWMHAFYAEEKLTLTPETLTALETLVCPPANAPPSGQALLIRDGAIPAGYFILTFGFSLERGGRIALLDELYLSPPHRNRGLGKAALQSAIALATNAGSRALLLEVSPNNPRARHLYAAARFAPLDRHLLALPLPTP